MTVAEAIRAAAERLASTSDTARLDAELLMAHALGVPRSRMLLHHMRHAVPESFEGLLERRDKHEPVAYIIGSQEFYGLQLAVTSAVLIPRSDSEVLIEAARELFADIAPKRVIDLGTGSGALLLAALSIFPQARGVGIDASAPATVVTAANALRLGMERRAQMIERDWSRSGWYDGLGRFDLILCNPPYVETTAELDPSVRDYEPAAALFAGADGLDAYRILIPQLRALMVDRAAAIIEIGHRQAASVAAIARAAGFAAALRRDLAGRPRALVLS